MTIVQELYVKAVTAVGIIPCKWCVEPMKEVAAVGITP